mgnify:CR=1 FL=1
MSDKETNFVSHLTELRQRLIHSLIFLIILFGISYYFSDHIYGFLVEPYASAVKNDDIERRLIFTALQETFMTYIKVSFFAAFFATSPFILIQVWKFIAPGLYKHEKKAIMPYLILTPILFFLGGMLVYYLIMPLAIKFFLSFESTGASTNLPIQLEAKVNEYLSLVMKLIFAFGLSFQLPIVLSLLARVGFIDAKFLKERRYKWIRKQFRNKSKFVVFDVPLLFEKDNIKKYDRIITMICSEKIQMTRVLKRNGWDEKRFELTKKQQLEEREKKKLADIIINTDRGKRYVYNKITNILKKSAATKTRTNYEIVYNFKK